MPLIGLLFIIQMQEPSYLCDIKFKKNKEKNAFQQIHRAYQTIQIQIRQGGPIGLKNLHATYNEMPASYTKQLEHESISNIWPVLSP